ncbi:hypothetical protein UlMin_006843 [Ulmus minor]
MGIDFLRLMEARGIRANSQTYLWLLEGILNSGSLVDATKLHCRILKLGFDRELVQCDRLMDVYISCGDFHSAVQVLDEMPHTGISSWNKIIYGFLSYKFNVQVLDFFQKMTANNVDPNETTYAGILKACGGANVGILYVKQIHARILCDGFGAAPLVCNPLIDLYSKRGSVDSARNVFDNLLSKDSVSWVAMISGLSQNGRQEDAVILFCQMHTRGISSTLYIFSSVLSACTKVELFDIGRQIHCLLVKGGFSSETYVCNALVTLYARARNFISAEKIFSTMQNRDGVSHNILIDMYAKHGKLDTALGILGRLKEDDVVSWTAMIAGYTQHDLFSEALKLFEEMEYRGIRPDNIGFSSAVSACAGIKALNQGRQIHAQSCVSGYSNDLSIGNALVTLYAKCGRIQEAYRAFEKIDAKDNISWNGLISGFAQSGYCEEALQIYTKMNRAEVKGNLFTFCSAVSAAANLANIKQGKQLHAMILKTGYNLETEASNVLITLYAKCGTLDDAKKEFSEISEKNEISWNAMITAYSQHGCAIKALNAFKQMKEQRVLPSHVTYVSVLSACSHAGLVNEGLDYFESMRNEHGLVPKPEHYVCVVDLLGRAGLLTDAKRFIDRMPIKPDTTVWRTLLSACAVHKNGEIGEFAAHHLLELEPEDSATYVLLSNIYAVTGKWNLRDQTRKIMKERGLKKEPGRSWIEANNSFHAFFVGDQLHPFADKIYRFLDDLNKQAIEIGYVQERYSLLNDVEQELRDPTVHIHSEKLAIAFGLLSLTNALPIHVIKNLRICNDCHNWIKYVSKISNRAIVVRDPYRFHHFEAGLCSCKDYW